MKKLLCFAIVLALSLAMFAMPTTAAHTPGALLKSIKHLAEEGGILNCDFTVEDSLISDMISEYGHPDRDNYVSSAKGNYATFSRDNIVAGYNKGEQVFELRSYSKRLHIINKDDLLEEWGRPDHSTKSGSETMESYVLNHKYNIKFVFESNDILNHYNVIWLDGTEDSMAGDHGRNW